MRRVLVLFCSVVLTSLAALAADPPGRVARLNYITGQVSLQPGGANDWVAANINRPLTTADRVWTDRDSRAELQMGPASVRLNGETSLTLANVSDNAVQLQLDQGTLNLHIVKLFGGEVYEVDTPNLAFTVEKAGDYRFDVDNAGDTTVVTVWNGRGEAIGDNPGIKIGKNQQYTFRGGHSLQYAMTNAPGFDGFDSWCMARAEREDKSPSLRYVSPYEVGYSDLDEYGQWTTVAPYGPVWVPAGVAVGWAPYRWGHWVYIAPWGWTWVDDAPWGFAPFHYGRWVNFGSYWGWCPGPYHPRPIWAPALVGWVGGPHWGVGLSFGVGGGVGWFPLGWGEPYIPYYRASRGYFRNVNVTNTHITNITYITNNYYGGRNVDRIHYVNMHAPQAITAVSNTTFVHARPTRHAMVPVTAQSLTGVSVVHDVSVRPTHRSMFGPGQRTLAPPVTATRPVVTRMNPPARPVAPIFRSDAARPDRGPASFPGTNAPRPNDSINRPSRAIPRPSQTNQVTMADEMPRGIPHPPDSIGNSPRSGNMPSRVPRPNSGYSPTPNASPLASAPAAQPMHVPHPPDDINRVPAAANSVPGDRSSRGMTTNVPHPPASVITVPAVNRESRPITHTEAPPSIAAPMSPHPDPTPHQPEPPRSSMPERNNGSVNNSHSEMHYPRPSGNVTRPPAPASSSVSRPAASAPAASPYHGSYTPPRAGSNTSRPVMQSAPPARSSYGGGSRPSQPVAHSSNGGSHPAPHASNSGRSTGKH